MNKLVGTNSQGVVDLMLERRRSGYRPGGVSNRKLALVVEGGGMRGVLSAGSLLAVDLLGFRGCFDEVYATSAGGVNAAYFLSGQGVLGMTVYFDDISNRRFINPWRVLKMVDVDFVYDEIVTHAKPLDEAALRSSPTKFLLSTTDALSGENVLLDVRALADPIPLMLKASSALPVLYNKVVPLGAGLYVDGGISDAMPIKQAIAAGCTDILVLTTKLSGHVGRPRLFHKAMIHARMGWRYPNLVRAYDNSFCVADANRRIAAGSDRVPGLNIATICPEPVELIVSKTTLKRSKLIAGSRTMAHRTYQVFGGDSTQIDRIFAAFEKGIDASTVVAAAQSV